MILKYFTTAPLFYPYVVPDNVIISEISLQTTAKQIRLQNLNTTSCRTIIVDIFLVARKPRTALVHVVYIHETSLNTVRSKCHGTICNIYVLNSTKKSKAGNELDGAIDGLCLLGDGAASEDSLRKKNVLSLAENYWLCIEHF